MELKPSVDRSGMRQSGMALIVVMLVILILSGLAASFAYSMRVEMRLARNSNNSSEMEWLGRSGMELARYVIAMQARIPGQNSFEALNQKWAGGFGVTNELLADINLQNVQLGRGTISIKITDLERKFNINAADEQLMQQALALIGVDASQVSIITDSILDWRDPDNDPRINGAENDYYLNLNPPYFCKNGYFDDPSELLLVKGINSDIYWGPRATNHFISTYQTMSSRKANRFEEKTYPVGLVDLFNTLSAGRLNLNTASATTLQMIPMMDQNMASEIVRARAGLDGVDGTEDDTPFTSVQLLGAVPGIRPDVIPILTRYCDVRSHTFDVQAEVVLDGFKRVYHGVLRRNSNNMADLVLVQFYWN
jgi:type II secretory pathway component PulK